MSVPDAMVVTIPKDIVFTSFENDRYLLLEIGKGNYFELDGTAGYLWSLWRQDGSVARSVEKLASRYRIDPKTSEADVLELIADLERKALVAVANRE